MKQYVFRKRCNGPLLAEELSGAIPEAVKTKVVDGLLEAEPDSLRVETTEAEARVTVNDRVTKDAVERVVLAHDRTKESANEAAARERAAGIDRLKASPDPNIQALAEFLR